jgi:hypothetical protein
MKNFKSYIIISSIIITLFSGCDAIIFERGNGDFMMRTVSLEEFDEIFLNGNYEVFLDHGDESKVVIKTDENLQDFIKVEVRNGTLAISNTERIKGSDGIKIFITYENLKRLDSGGASSVYTTSPISGSRFELSMSGAGVMDLEVELEELEIRLSGAGWISMEGSVQRLDVSLTGAGSMEAFNLESRDCEISISGVGSAEINVTGNLVAKISGVGGIEYRGSPEDIRREISGFGKIKAAP